MREENPEQEQTFSIHEAAAYLGIKPNTLMNWRSERRGPPAYKLGKRVIYRKKLLDRWLAEQLEIEPGQAS